MDVNADTHFLITAAVGVLVTLAIAVIATWVVGRAAVRFGVVDTPTSARKLHTRPVPLLGGVAVLVAFACGVGLLWPDLVGGYLLPKHLIGVLLAAAIIAVGGVLDDIFDLRPSLQIIFPVVATLVVVASGIGIEYISNPFGEAIRLDSIQWRVVTINGLPYFFTLFADLFTVMWLLLMMYTTKFLDGLDGLVSGITVIGSVILFFLSLTTDVFQPETATIAAITAAAFLGFLFFNWHPAKIFLGESGSLVAGFILGVLAIISGAKVATTVLILGIPLLDAAWVVVRRLFFEKRSPFTADRKHLHQRLVDIGLTQRQAVLLLYTLTAVFGVGSLFLQSTQKVTAFIAVAITMIILGSFVVWKYKRRGSSRS